MADKTLDDIIKQKRQQRFGSGNLNRRGNQFKKMAPRNLGQGMTARARLYKEVQKDLGITTKKPLSLRTDARNRIIQAKKTKYADARDRLAQIAKQGDARDKLNKIRKMPGGKKVVPQQQKTVVKKKITNVPKQASKPVQNRTKGAAIVRTVAGKPTMNGSVSTQGSRARQRARQRAIARNPRSLVTVKNDAQVYETVYEDVGDYRQELQLVPRSQPLTIGVPTVDTVYATRSEPLIRSRAMETPIYTRDYEPEVRPSRLRITAANPDYRIGQQYIEEWEPQTLEVPVQSRVQPRSRALYDDQVEYQVYPQKIQTVPTLQVQDRGTKVVVSNLHPCVSVEDMEELFGTIGQVLSVRMVREGVAEAMFINQEDAYRSVDLFNNRQLDGQPMKVMVVRKKALMPTPTIQSRSILKSARGRTGYYIQ